MSKCFHLEKKTGGKQTNQIKSHQILKLFEICLMVFVMFFFLFSNAFRSASATPNPLASECLPVLVQWKSLGSYHQLLRVLQFYATNPHPNQLIPTNFHRFFPCKPWWCWWVLGDFPCFFGGKHTPCPSRMPVSNQGVELTPSRSVTRRWGENQNLSERLRFGDGKLSWNAWNMYIYCFGNR